MNTISRRGLVLIISFITALVIVLAALSLVSYNRAKSAELKLEYSYLRAVENLNDHMNSIDSTLTKGKYATTATMLESLANKLKSDTQGAKDNISQLPLEALNLEHTYQFLSQLGEYALSISRKVSNGEKITEEELNNMESLGQYCKSLREQVMILEDSVQTGTVSFREITKQLSNEELSNNKSLQVMDGFKEYEEGFSSFPSLIYDGPFIDHLMQKKSVMLKGKSDVTRTEARKAAAKIAQIRADLMEDAGDDDGIMPTYNFMSESTSVSVTKAGGMPVYLLKNRNVDDIKISKENAVKLARQYLTTIGIGSLTESYYEIAGNIITINFAHLQNDITVYADLIKVSVAMDNGEILGFDARGYLTNHIERTISAPKISLDAARKKVSQKLTIKKEKLAIIPSTSLTEKLCYEFLCTGQDGENILVYINANTGEEEEILILLIDENGTLTI